MVFRKIKSYFVLDSTYYKWMSSLAECATDHNQVFAFPHTVRLCISIQHV